MSRAAAWAEHLRDGGTTPWSDFDGNTATEPDWLPGAQQLELLRRVNLVAPASPALTERILTAPLPFRGRPDLDLATTGGSGQPDAGAPTVDPAALSDDELVRVAVAVLAEATVTRPTPPLPVTGPGRLRRLARRLRHTPVRIAGDPVRAAALRAELTDCGRPLGDGGPVVVVAGPIDRMLADAWWHRVVHHGAPPWPQWLDSLVARDRVPPSIDLPGVASRWETLRPGRVVIACDLPSAARVAGLPKAPVDPVVEGTRAELERRIGSLLAVTCVPAERTRLLRAGVLPLGVRPDEPVTLALTPAAHAWASEQATRMVSSLRAGGYPVEGDLADLEPVAPPRDRPGRLISEGLIPLAIAALHASTSLESTPNGGAQ